jgi:hypothetical protein
MPYGALGLTVTGAPAWPLFDDEVGVALGEGEAVGELVALVALPAVMLAGTETASGPSTSSTCPGATRLLAVAVTPLK